MMTRAFEWLISQRRLVLTLAAAVALMGMVMWMTMIRQEDPRLPDFWGQIIAPYPGADAETVERLILEPVEDALAEVDQIKVIRSSAFGEMAVLTVELHGNTMDVDKAWDDVRAALRKAHREFPGDLPLPVLDEEQQDQDAIVLAVTGSSNALTLLDAARQIRKQLLHLKPVSRVHFIGTPGEQVTVKLDDAAANRLGITPAGLAAALHARNRILPGGSLNVHGRTLKLRPLSEFSSVAEISATQVLLQDGSSIPLSEVATVGLGPVEPVAALMRCNGQMCVGIAIVPQKAINLVAFGDRVRGVLDRLGPGLAPLRILEVTFQPKHTAARLGELNRSLVLGILIVGGVLIISMGLRMGIMVALVVPLVAMASVAVFAMGGGVLHQISIAALVLSLGMLVDNAIVVSENVQWRLDRGTDAVQAGVESVRELSKPLAGATATTLAAFIPMLISRGPTAEFTKTIPVVIMLTLTISYLFAILVTPNLARLMLRPEKTRRQDRIGRLGRHVARFAIRQPWGVLLVALVFMGVTLHMAGRVQRQFFPTSDRNQLLVDLKLPEGVHIDETDRAARNLESALLKRSRIHSVAAFIGRSAPHFYYNVNRVPFSPHFAQLIVETRKKSQVNGELAWIRQYMTTQSPDVEIVARMLEQGPPVDAPVEIRLFSENLEDLRLAAEKTASLLQKIPGTVDVRQDLGPGVPTLLFHINDAAAARYKVNRAQVAQALYGHTRGLPAGQLYRGEDPVDIVVRSSAGERTPVSILENIQIRNNGGRGVPLSQIVRPTTCWRPAVIRHHNGIRVVTVSSQLARSVTFSDILKRVKPMLAQSGLPASVRIGMGGDAEGAGEANTALMKSFPIGILCLLGVLLVEFNSFRRLAIILVTVPLAAVGVVPGLLLAGQPFGFMSMLGVIALVGIVVNNAIVLIELIDQERCSGLSAAKAIEQGVRQRIRPILLTSATTIAGLLPLAFSESTLWPPLATAMISGLMASTLLTLIVVPALYRLLLDRSGKSRAASMVKMVKMAVVVTALTLMVASPPVEAVEPMLLNLSQAMRCGGSRPLVEAGHQQALAAGHHAAATRNATVMPIVTVSAGTLWRDRQLDLQTPLGGFPYMQKEDQTLGLKIMQPVFHPSQRLFEVPAAEADARSEACRADRMRQIMAARAAAVYLNVRGIHAQREATLAFIRSIEARLREIRSMIAAGRALEVDGLKIQLVFDQARQDLHALENAHGAALGDFMQGVGMDAPAAPMAAPSLMDRLLPDENQMVARAMNARKDLQQYMAQQVSLQNRYAAVNAEYWPRVDAVATFNWIKDAPYQTDRWAEAALQITWTPFAARSRNPRKAVLLARQKAVSLQIRETRRQIGVEIAQALSDMRTARGKFEVEIHGVAQAAETLRVERRRYMQGRSTANDLLEAEAALHGHMTRRALSRLEELGAWVRLWLAVGEDRLWFLDAASSG